MLSGRKIRSNTMLDDEITARVLAYLMKLQAEWELNPYDRSKKHYAGLLRLIEEVKEQCAEYKWFNNEQA